MSAVYVNNLVINAGADFGQTFTIEENDANTPLDLTPYTASSQMRKHAGSSSAVNFTTVVTDPANGNVRVSLSSTITSTLKPGRYVYDVVLNDGNTLTRVIEGMVLVREGVTR